MNYYNPYVSMMPYTATPNIGAGKGLFKSLFGGGIKWGNIFNYTQKTLGIINQGIPVVKQITPVVRNMKTMFKVMSEFKRVDTPSLKSDENISSTSGLNTSTKYNNTQNNYANRSNEVFSDGPVFFV